MPFEVSWYQPERVVLMKVEGVMIPAEVEKAISETIAMLADSKNAIHFLVDTRTLQRIENIPSALKAVQSGPVHPNMGWMIVVGRMNPMVKFVLDFVGLLIKARYRRFDTMPEGLAFLKEIDGTLVLQ
ncbi:MAG: hypothetical protein ABI700_23980 [Chloroflexota bacterium]